MTSGLIARHHGRRKRR